MCTRGHPKGYPQNRLGKGTKKNRRCRGTMCLLPAVCGWKRNAGSAFRFPKNTYCCSKISVLVTLTSAFLCRSPTKALITWAFLAWVMRGTKNCSSRAHSASVMATASVGMAMTVIDRPDLPVLSLIVGLMILARRNLGRLPALSQK